MNSRIMRLTIASSLYLSWLLKHAVAIPSIQARQDVGIQSVNLVFNSDCNRQSDIQTAWDDAIRLVTNLPKVDFNDVAAIEFFGPPALNSKQISLSQISVQIIVSSTDFCVEDYQSNIQAVFDSAKTFGQGWRITPTPLKVQINVGCGANADREMDSRCKAKGPGLKAYTWNTENSDGSGKRPYNNKYATMNMYVCNSFFAYMNLDDRIKEYKDDSDYTHKYNMQYYTNRGESHIRTPLNALDCILTLLSSLCNFARDDARKQSRICREWRPPHCRHEYGDLRICWQPK